MNCHVNCDETSCCVLYYRSYMGGDGDYNLSSSAQQQQQAALMSAAQSSAAVMYNMMTGVSPNMYPSTMSYFDPSMYAMPQDNPHHPANTSRYSTQYTAYMCAYIMNNFMYIYHQNLLALACHAWLFFSESVLILRGIQILRIIKAFLFLKIILDVNDRDYNLKLNVH